MGWGFLKWVLTGTTWKSNITPHDLAENTAHFQYDSRGRATDVFKLRTPGTPPWTYVQTHTDYLGDGPGAWGQAGTATEDVGGIARQTATSSYDWAGHTTSVTDASGQTFVTAYEPDGEIDSVTKTNGGGQTIVSYAYYPMNDSVLARRGQVETITDGLSGVVQTVDYTAAGGGTGQPSSVSENDNGVTYSCAYTYNNAGDRATASYTTPNGTVNWGYGDYIARGIPEKPRRPFQTLNKLDSYGAPTSEEFHYEYDTMGRLTNAAFMQTPQAGQTGYSANYPALVRARVLYNFDVSGTMPAVGRLGDTWNGSSYTTGPILGRPVRLRSRRGMSRLERGL